MFTIWRWIIPRRVWYNINHTENAGADAHHRPVNLAVATMCRGRTMSALTLSTQEGRAASIIIKGVFTMCTAATYTTDSFYFGRNLDYEFSYGDEVTVTPRAYPFSLRCMGDFRTKYAMIGMAYVAGEYPLYYDAVNEKGLGIAGLNFVGNAVYHPAQDGKSNVAQFELIPWLLGSCATLAEVRTLLAKTNIVNIPFSEQLPLAQLHWLIADKTGSIVVESTADGLHIYDNPVGVLTNNPPFPIQLFNLNNYRGLSVDNPENRFSEQLELNAYSRGMGAIGLPGDLSSASRFVRVAFTKMNSLSADDEKSSVSQFFHILGSVDQQRGCCRLADGKYEISIYTSCCNADKGIYYYKTYDNHSIVGVDMNREELDGAALISYPLKTDMEFEILN